MNSDFLLTLFFCMYVFISDFLVIDIFPFFLLLNSSVFSFLFLFSHTRFYAAPSLQVFLA